MPHYKCVACRARLHVSGVPAEVADLCPACGSLLQPVVELEELIGFRSIRPFDSAPDPVQSKSHKRIAATVDGFLTRRAAVLERDRADPGKWLDDNDPLAVAAVALPPGQNPF